MISALTSLSSQLGAEIFSPPLSPFVTRAEPSFSATFFHRENKLLYDFHRTIHYFCVFFSSSESLRATINMNDGSKFIGKKEKKEREIIRLIYDRRNLLLTERECH